MWVVRDSVCPQRAVEVQVPVAGVAMSMPGMEVVSWWAPRGREYMTEAVWRRWLSAGARASGAMMCPMEYWAAQFGFGTQVRRVEMLSGARPLGEGWRCQRASVGSAPWKPETSRRKGPWVRPAVMTLKAMWVESCWWWPRAAIGSSEAEARCG